VGTAALVLLTLFAAREERARFADAPGIDFYQYWAVPLLRSVVGPPLGDPYLQAPAYAAALDAFAEGRPDRRLDEARSYRRRPEFFQTPLLFLAFAPFPRSYTAARALYHALQLAGLAAGLVWLGRAFAVPSRSTLLFGLAALVAFAPVGWDLNVGNVALLQWPALALAVWAASRPEARAGLRAAAVPGLVFWVLAKPTVALTAGVLLLALAWPACGRRLVGIVALASGVAFLAAPCLYFGSWAVWWHWYEAVVASGRLGIPTAEGNLSVPLLLAGVLGIGQGAALGLVAGALLLSLAAAWSVRRGAGGGIEAGGHALPALLALSIGGTTAMLGLVWPHYQVLFLLPGVTWLAGTGALSRPAALTLLALVMASAQVTGFFGAATTWKQPAVTVHALAWLPLWLAGLDRLARGDGRPPRAGLIPSASP
jgi:hypothetical protein